MEAEGLAMPDTWKGLLLCGVLDVLLATRYFRIAMNDLFIRKSLSVRTSASSNSAPSMVPSKSRALSINRIASPTVGALLQCPNEDLIVSRMRIGLGSQWKNGIMQCGSIGNQ